MRRGTPSYSPMPPTSPRARVRQRLVAEEDASRGPASPAVLRLVVGMVPGGHAAAETNLGRRPRLSGCETSQWRCRMAELPPPPEGIVLTHFIVSDDVERSRRFSTEVLGGRVSFRESRSMSRSPTAGSSSIAAEARPMTSRRSAASHATRDRLGGTVPGSGDRLRHGDHYVPHRPSHAERYDLSGSGSTPLSILTQRIDGHMPSAGSVSAGAVSAELAGLTSDRASGGGRDLRRAPSATFGVLAGGRGSKTRRMRCHDENTRRRSR
jgi:hypothetical protein